jgi:hypothetical protein
MTGPSAAVRRGTQADFSTLRQINDLAHSGSDVARTPVWMALVIGLIFMASAVALLVGDALQRGLSIHHCLQPVLAIGAAAAAIYAHHAFASWRFGYGLAFLVVAVLGSLLVVYGTMGRQADAREARQSGTRAGNEAHAETKAELVTAKANRDKECKAFGPKCSNWQARVDALGKQLGSLHTAALDPRAEAIGDMASLVGFDRRRTMEIVEAVDPIALPMWLELGSIVFLGAAFPPGKRPRKCGKSEETVTLATESEESVSTFLESEPLAYTRGEALADFRAMRTSPSQKVLASRWGVSEGTVSKWLTAWARDQLISRGDRLGRERAVLALPAPRGGG